MKLYNKKFPNIFFRKDKRGRINLYTQNFTPGLRFFEEDIVKFNGNEYRFFDARRSKLAASILKGISQTGIKEDSYILYLGASHGYTPSFLSDIISEKGFIYAVEFAPRVIRDLVFLSEKRNNIVPIFGDANQPLIYKSRITNVDIVYQDVAQRNQAEIFLKNCDMFLKKGGFGLLAVKSRSIDMAKKPRQVYQEVRALLEKNITIVDYKILDPFEKDHCMFIVKKK